MKTQTQWLFEAPNTSAPIFSGTPYSFRDMDDAPLPLETRKRDGGIETGGVERIRRPRSSSLRDEQNVDGRIPTGKRNAVEMGVPNTTYSTEGEAKNAAERKAAELGTGYKVFHEGKHGPNQLPHYHITGPNGRVKGKFFYGGQPLYNSPKGKPEKLRDITQKAGKEVKKTKPKDGLARREKNTNKVAVQAIESRAAKKEFQREYEANYLFEAPFP